jgi:hypothetical protein
MTGEEPHRDRPSPIGHADIRTTMNTYGHLSPNHDDAVAHALDGAFRACLAASERPPGLSYVHSETQMVTQERPSRQVLWLITRAVSSAEEHCAYRSHSAETLVPLARRASVYKRQDPEDEGETPTRDTGTRRVGCRRDEFAGDLESWLVSE